MAIEQTPELEQALQGAFERKASDVFLIPGEPLTFRVRGEIQRTETDPLTADRVRATAAAAIGEEALERIRRETGEARTTCGLPGVIDAQLTVASTLGDYSVCVRILPALVLDVEVIGMPKAMVEACEAPHGLIIVAGLTGSGKTTAAVSLVDHINATRPVHIATVEDPVGPRLTPKRAVVQQHEVTTDVPSVLAGIRSVLFQDLDVLYVNELREVSEVDAVVTVADAGHLVIVVGHAASPEDMIQRFIDIHPPETRETFARRLAGALLAVSVQRLLPNASGKGRVAAYGVLTPDDETRRAMIEGRDLAKRATPLPAGCQTLAEAIRQLEAAGTVTHEAAEKALSD
jgi:twitching motility protein PilT